MIEEEQQRQNDFQSGGVWSLRAKISSGKKSVIFYFMKKWGPVSPQPPSFDTPVEDGKIADLLEAVREKSNMPWSCDKTKRVKSIAKTI